MPSESGTADNEHVQQEREIRKQERELKRKREKEAFKAAQKDNALLRQREAEHVQEKKNLEAKLQSVEERINELTDEQPSKKRSKTDDDEEDSTDSGTKNAETTALHVGKLITIKFKMWTTWRALEYLPPSTHGQSSDDEQDEDIPQDVQEETKADAELIWQQIPESVRAHIGLAKVKAKLRDGLRGIRSQTVDNVVNIAHEVFDVPSTDFPEFKDKSKRPLLPAVQLLLKHDRFLYDRLPDTVANRREGYMRHPCIHRILRIVMLGKSAVTSGRATKARSPYAKILDVRSVTLPMLAFAATIAYFVLSSQPELSSEGSGGFEFNNFYDEQIRRLKRAQNTSVASNRRLQAFIEHLNKDLFPAHHDAKPQSERSKQEDAFNAALEEEAEQEKAEQEAQDAQERQRRANEMFGQENEHPSQGGDGPSGGDGSGQP